MNLQQLRYLAAIAQNDLNITAAAQKLRASQPAVSRQLKLLEDELGFKLFVREGRSLQKLTPMGERVIDRALRILHEARVIKRISDDVKDEARGVLSIGTTHTQARYVLPSIVKAFRAKYPAVDLHLHQGTSEQIAELAKLDRIDIAIATGSTELFSHYTLLPCYQWHRCLVVPRNHALVATKQVTLQQIAGYPIVTYVFSFSGPSSLQDLFAAEGLQPRVALTARDADVIKTYVRLGLGVGIIADVAVDPVEDRDLVAIDAAHLFPMHTTWAGFTRGGLLRGYMYDFLQLLAPHLSRRLVERASRAAGPEEVDAIFADVPLSAARRIGERPP